MKGKTTILNVTNIRKRRKNVKQADKCKKVTKKQGDIVKHKAV